MKRFFYFTLLLSLFSSCNSCDECIENLSEIYSEGEVLLFKNQYGDHDTILVDYIYSSESAQTMDQMAGKNILVGIQHLPKNKWISHTVLMDNGETKTVNESIIRVHCHKRTDSITLSTQFMGNSFSKVIAKELPDEITMQNEHIRDSTTIVNELVFDLEDGLQAYTKNDTLLYKFIERVSID